MVMRVSEFREGHFTKGRRKIDEKEEKIKT